MFVYNYTAILLYIYTWVYHTRIVLIHKKYLPVLGSYTADLTTVFNLQLVTIELLLCAALLVVYVHVIHTGTSHCRLQQLEVCHSDLYNMRHARWLLFVYIDLFVSLIKLVWGHMRKQMARQGSLQ